MSVQIMSENTASDGHGQEEDILVLKCKHWYTDFIYIYCIYIGIQTVYEWLQQLVAFTKYEK